MQPVLKGLDRALTKLLEAVVIIGMGALTLDVLWGVLSRYILSNPSQWTDELATILLIWVSLLGGALAYRDRSHLGVDYFVNLMHPASRKGVRIFIQLLVITFALMVMTFGGYKMVVDTLGVKQVLPALGILKGYVYIAMPVSGLFIVWFGFENLLEILRDEYDKADETMEAENSGN